MSSCVSFSRSPCPTILLLSDELLIKIFILSAASDIRRWHQVCRRFKSLVEGSSEIIYLLEINDLGYAPGSSSRTISFNQKIGLLRRHIERLYFSSKIAKPTLYGTHLLSPKPRIYSEFSKGYYVKATDPGASNTESFRRLEIIRLQSFNRNVRGRIWTHEDLGGDMVNMGIDPEADLLVLIEFVGKTQSGLSYRIHIRSITSRVVHVNAARPILDYVCRKQTTTNQRTSIQILGSLVAILFPSAGDEKVPNYLIIWDWTTGYQVTYAEIYSALCLSFSFISEDMFVVPQKGITGETSIFASTLGTLDTYRFDKLIDPGPTYLAGPASHVASLHLPVLMMNECPTLRVLPSSLSISHNPLTGSTPPPNIYKIPHNHHLLGVELKHPDFRNLQGTLFIPLTGIISTLSAIGSSENTLQTGPSIPWTSWGQGLWAPPGVHLANPGCAVYGYRIVSRLSPHSDFLIMVDVDFARLKAIPIIYHPIMCKGNCLTSDCGMADGEECAHWGEGETNRDLLARMRINQAFRRTGMRFITHRLQGDFGMHGISSKIYMDEEHVVVETGSTIWTYSF